MITGVNSLVITSYIFAKLKFFNLNIYDALNVLYVTIY
ncbi:MAG: hypothetical protein JWR38_1464 [Mucilaginibacter sp.]|nr:hypothetical protein [Mucilaginibacter sp.]